MRTVTPIIILAAALAFAPVLAAQTASYSEAIALTPSEPAVDTEFLMDTADFVEILISSASKTLEVALVDPDGGVHPAGMEDTVVAGSLVSDLAEGDVQGRSHLFELTNTRAGVWKFRSRETGELTKTVAVLFTMTSSSDLVARLLGASDDFDVSRPIDLGLLLADGDGKVGSGSIRTINASIQTGRDTPVPIEFADDGLRSDPIANDGVYASTFTAPAPGKYLVNVNISGVHRGSPFLRSVAGVIRAVDPCALFISDSFISTPVDTSGLGTPDALDLEFSVNVSRDGRYQVSAVLSSAKKQQTGAVAEVDLVAGPQTAKVRFDLSRLADLGDNGPYQADEVRVGCIVDGSVQTSDRRSNAGATTAIDVAAALGRAKAPARSGGIGVTGANTEQTGAVPYQRLDFGLGLDVPTTGAYQWNGALYDSNGVQVDAVSGSGNLTAGKTTAIFSFGGSKIGRNAIDGPFFLRNVVIQGAAGPATFPEAGQTQPYPYYKFLDSPSRKAIEVSPAALSFGSIVIGQTKDLTLTILSAGNATLAVSAMASGDTQFSVTAGGAPFSLTAGTQRSVTIGFQPTKLDAQSASLTITSDDPGRPSLVVALTGAGTPAPAPGIEVTPTSLDFGTVNSGQAKDLTLTIRNVGTASVAVNSVTSSNARFAFTQPAAPFNIAAGASQTATVRFSPIVAGALTGTLTIASSDPVTPSAQVSVTGTGAGSIQAPVIDVTPLSLDFGTVPTAQTKDLVLTVRNNGAETLSVTNLTSSNSRFTFQPSSSFNVGAGSFQTVAVRFSAASSAVETGTATLTSNDPAQPTVSVSLSANSGSMQVIPTNVTAWPNGRTVDNLPSNAIDGNTNTFTWSTNSFNMDAPSYLGLDFGTTKTISRIRLFKDAEGGGGQNMKNLVIEYTASDPSSPLSFRTWTAVSGLTNGVRGTELLTATSVNSNGTVSGDTHNSPASGWASLTFNTVNATGVRVGFSNPGGTSFVNHYRVYEFQAYNESSASARQVTLQIDDGTFEDALGLPDGAPEIDFANRLTPSGYPATLSSVQVFFGSSASALPLGQAITILAAANPGGTSNISGISYQRIAGTISIRNGFQTVNLVTPITINSGDFVVGFATFNPLDKYPMAIDYSSAAKQRSYIGTNSNNLTLVETLNPDLAGNFAIRAVADVP